MTSQEKKEYLWRYKTSDNEIDDLLREKERIMSKLTRMTPSISGMPGNCGGADRVTDGISKLIDLEKEIDKKVDKLVDLRREIVSYIDAVDSSAQRRLLQLRYIHGMTWERVAVEMGYERMQVWRLHGKALAALNMG